MRKLKLVVRGKSHGIGNYYHNDGNGSFHHYHLFNKKIRLGVEVSEKKYKHLSHLFVSDPENWITKNPNGAAVIEIPAEFIWDQDKCRNYLIDLGIITAPPYILNDPDISVETDSSCFENVYDINGRDYNHISIDVDISQCKKSGEYWIKGTKITLPEGFNTFLGLIEDPASKIEQYIKENQLVLKSRSTSDGTIDGFPLIIRQRGKTKKELEEEAKYWRMKWHRRPTATKERVKPELKYVYTLAIPKKGNEHLCESFIKNPEDWFVDGFNPETHVLIEIPFEYIETMSIQTFITTSNISK